MATRKTTPKGDAAPRPKAKRYSRTVADPSSAVKKMRARWELVGALLEGTDGMRLAGEALLPRWPNEDVEAWNARLATSVLFPAYSRTVETLTGRPFSKPVTVGEDVPARLSELLGDVDRQGRDISAFAASVMEEALGKGGCGILVDMPRRATVLDDGSVAEVPNTVAAEREAGIRPYLVHIHPEQVLGWMHQGGPGEQRLTQLRLMECAEEPGEDEFSTDEVEQVRVLYPGRWETWRRSRDRNHEKDWELHDEGPTSMDRIPYVQVYGRRTAFMEHRPPMYELAHLCAKHWRSQSDQDNILHVARVPILVTVGCDEAPVFTIGSSAAINLPGEHSDMKFVEHTGASIDAGQASLDKLEEHMQRSGAEMLVIKAGPVTATEIASDNAAGMCDLQRVTTAEEDALDMSLELMAEFMGERSGGHVEIYKDFAVASLSDAAANILQTANGAGTISDETLRSEFKRRGILAADVDEEEEKERIAMQGPKPGAEDPPEEE